MCVCVCVCKHAYVYYIYIIIPIIKRQVPCMGTFKESRLYLAFLDLLSVFHHVNISCLYIYID